MHIGIHTARGTHGRYPAHFVGTRAHPHRHPETYICMHTYTRIYTHAYIDTHTARRSWSIPCAFCRYQSTNSFTYVTSIDWDFFLKSQLTTKLSISNSYRAYFLRIFPSTNSLTYITSIDWEYFANVGSTAI